MNALVAKSPPELTTILVGNLADHAGEEDVRALFRRFGSVSEIRLIHGARHRRADSRCYVMMRGRPAKTAISALDGAVFMGAILRVTEAQTQTVEPAQAPPAAEEEQPGPRLRQRYQVVSVEEAKMPGGTEGTDWCRYVLSCGTSRVNGLRRGSLEEVNDYASHCVEELNQRSAGVKSSYAMTLPQKK